MTKAKPTHGGKRTNAGAKPKDAHTRRKVSLYLRVDFIAAIDAEGESRNATIERALGHYLARDKR